MKIHAVVVLLLLLSVELVASSLDVDTGTYKQTEPTIAWWAGALYLNDAGEIGVGVAMGASVALWDSYGYKVNEAAATVYGGSWSYNGEYDGGWSICYSTTFAAQTFDRYAQDYGNSSCNGQPPSPPPPPDCLLACHDNQDEGYCEGPGYPCWNSPLFLNFGTGSYVLTAPAQGVSFDMDGDGDLEQTAWTLPDANQGFLCMDRNENGSIDGGAELFGTATLAQGGAPALNGFEALAVLDVNGDGKISPLDAAWSELRIWTDVNHDGVAQSTELHRLESLSIDDLELNYQWTGRRDRNNNLFRYQSRFNLGGRARPYYDVYLLHD